MLFIISLNKKKFLLLPNISQNLKLKLCVLDNPTTVNTNYLNYLNPTQTWNLYSKYN